MAKLKQTSITGSLIVSGSSILMPNLNGNVDSGSSGQLWLDDAPGLKMKFTQAGSLGSFNSPFSINGAWSAGGNMISALYVRSGAGTQNAALAAGGSAFPVYCQATEEYDGSSWSAGPNTITLKGYSSYGGSQNAAWIAGGTPGTLSCTEEYDGSSWSAGGAMITAKFYAAGAGSQNAAINMGGQTPSVTDDVQIYNGASWATETSMINTRRIFGGAGTQNATVAVGIYPGSTKNEDWDGVSWTEKNPLPQASNESAMSGCQYSNFLIGGSSPSPSVTDKVFYSDGINWSSDSSLITGRRLLAAAPGGGSVAAESSLVFGGVDSSNFSSTEEYSKTLFPFFTYSAWGKAANLSNARVEAGGTGTQNAALVAGAPNTTEEYDGSTWTAGGTLINVRTLGMFAFGTQNAAALAGGYPSDPGSTLTEEYGGSSWSAGGALITGRYAGNNASGGTQNAGVIFGGFNAPNSVTCTEEYNGSAWASGGAMIQGRRMIGGAGIQNSALAAGGLGPSPSYTMYTCHEQYNGTAWSAATALPIASQASFTSGDDNDNVLLTGGSCTSPSFSNLFRSSTWNGTSWANEGSLTQNRSQGMRAGSSTTALAAGGNRSPIANSTGITELYCSACESKVSACANTWTAIASLLSTGGYRGGWGTINAAAVAGGAPDGDATEEYNGSSWSTGGNKINSGVGFAVANAATQDAGMFGGLADPYRACTEEYNGSTWAAGGATNIVIGYRGGAGTQNAGLAIGGYMNAPLGAEGCVEEYNGSSWSNATAVPGYQQYEIPATGTQNDAVIAGGASNPPSINNHCATQHYDGSSWSAGGNLNVGRQSSDTMAGTSTAAIIVGGRTPTFLNDVEEYDGSTWSIGYKYPIKNQAGATLGSQNSAMNAGGRTPSYHNLAFVNTCSVYKARAFSVSSNLGTDRYIFGSFGTQNAAVAAGGNASPGPSQITTTENYDGASWSTSGNLIHGREEPGAAGTQDAGLFFGGYSSPSTGYTQEYDGSTWASGGNMIKTRRTLASLGTQNAAMAQGGRTPATCYACTEIYNGSSWSAAPQGMETYGQAGSGTTNAALVFGCGFGSDPQYGFTTKTYDGTGWSTVGNLNHARSLMGHSGIGTQNDTIAIGGYDGTRTMASLENFNGITWSTDGDFLQSIRESGNAGSTTNGLIFGGQPGSNMSSTHKFDEEPVRVGVTCFAKTIS